MGFSSVTKCSSLGLSLLLCVLALAGCTQEVDSEVARFGCPGGKCDSTGISFEEFRASIYREPGESGVYIVNADQPIADDKRLLEYFHADLINPVGSGLIVHQVNGEDARWDSARALELTYCISRDVGDYEATVAAMEGAGRAWEAVADVNFIHVAAEDSSCDGANERTIFNVSAGPQFAPYLARAFFPGEIREYRNMLIAPSAFEEQPSDELTLEGILRHELGHVLGFRHEHTRADSGTCFEDNSWRELTAYDQPSVMHYPQCNGTGSWALELTETDGEGAEALYGAPGTHPAPPPQEHGLTHRVFLGRSERAELSPIPVAAGTVLDVSMVGGGDLDLYVRFDDRPTLARFDCRSFTQGSSEECRLDVPEGASEARVMIVAQDRGYGEVEVAFTGAYPEGAVRDDHGAILAMANVLSLEVLMDGVRLGASAAVHITEDRPFENVMALEAATSVGIEGVQALAEFSPQDADPNQALSLRIVGNSYDYREAGTLDVVPGSRVSVHAEGRGELNLFLVDHADEAREVYVCSLNLGAAGDCIANIPRDVTRLRLQARGSVGIYSAELTVSYLGAAFASDPVDDQAFAVARANDITQEQLSAATLFSAAQRDALFGGRPYATYVELESAIGVDRAESFSLDAVRFFGHADEDTVLRVVNQMSYDGLVDIVGLSPALATTLVEQRPFYGNYDVDALWDDNARNTVVEFGNVTSLEGQQVLDFVLTASFHTLDEVVPLDVRAVRSILEKRPLRSIAELDALPFVGPQTLDRLYFYTSEHPMMF